MTAMRARIVSALAAAVLAMTVAPPAAAQPAPEPPADRCVVDRDRPDLVAACFAVPTDRYGHGVFGQRPGEPGEWAVLRIAPRDRMGPDGALPEGAFLEIELPTNRVFEDLVPRFVDMDGDGATEVLVIESDTAFGGALALYEIRAGAVVKRAQNEPIGTANRWLAPIGVADLDGDGRQEVAYVDRPHLAGQLRVLRLDGGRLTPVRFPNGLVAVKTGYSNHRYGEAAIHGGVRDCGDGPELLVADFGWSEIRAVRLTATGFEDRALSAPPRPDRFQAALRCPPETR